MNIITLSGSTRTGSHNQRLASAAFDRLTELGAQVTALNLSHYPLPLMDVDLQNTDGIPEAALELGRLIAGADGLFVASPEYNGSITPLLKNTIDWVSRISTLDDMPVKPWRDRVVCLGSAAPGKFGGVRSLPHIRAILQSVGCQVISEQVSIGNAASAFDGAGQLVGEAEAASLTKACQQLMRFAAA